MSSLKKSKILSSFSEMVTSLFVGLNLPYLIFDISKMLWVVKTSYWRQTPIIWTFFSAMSFCPSIKSLILLFSWIKALSGVNRLWAILLMSKFENFSVVWAFESLLKIEISLKRKRTCELSSSSFTMLSSIVLLGLITFRKRRSE